MMTRRELDLASVSIEISPAHGSLSVDPQTGRVTYTPDVDFHGDDAFVYEICDSTGACDTATVMIAVSDVNDPPLAEDDQAETITDIPVSIDVIDNDSDADGDLDPGSVVVTTSPAHGTTVVDPQTGAIEYTPQAGFSGTDSLFTRCATPPSYATRRQLPLKCSPATARR